MRIGRLPGSVTDYKIVGQRFGSLVVTGLHKRDKFTKNKVTWWRCKCDCGKTKSIRRNNLTQGSVTHCGCKSQQIRHDAMCLPYGEAAFNQIFNGYIQNSKVKNRVFSLSKRFFKWITQTACFYCGTKPVQVSNHKNYNGGYTYNGLDRVNNTKGYTTKNVVSCCEWCNRMKLDYDQIEFLKHVKQIYEHLDLKNYKFN